MARPRSSPRHAALVGLKGRHVHPFEQVHPRARAPGVFVSAWSAVLAVFGVRRVSMRAVRAEAFFIGNRHKGRIREGAQQELRAPGLDPDRAALLRAVIRMNPGPGSEGEQS